MELRIAFLLLACVLHAPHVSAQDDAPPLMLAKVYARGVDVSAYFVSEKLDGVRGRWDGTALYTRAGNRILAPAWFTAGWPAEPMDGELWIARGRFEDVSGIVRAASAGDDAWRRVRFMVFDLPAHGGPFDARVLRMRALIGEAGIPWLQPVAQFRVDDADALDAKLAEVVAAGGEGLMLHHHAARYRAGRSEDLLKYKPYDDAEARVVGHAPGEGKYAGMLGALIVERADGLRFRIGSGFTDAERADPPSIGRWITYRYNGLTDGGVPRFARFLRVRDDMPPPE